MDFDYPEVLSERLTMELAVGGRSIARIGDGELRLALGVGKHIAQVQDSGLACELREIMQDSAALCCIPNAKAPNGKPVMWGPTRYGSPDYTQLYRMARHYGSSFICRPDSAIGIDTDEYWLLCRSLWYDKEVTLVIGTRGGSFTHLVHARKVRLIYGPERDAYDAVPELMDKIGTPDHTVMICLGPAATILAERLARKNVHALDLGHMGRFMPQRFLQREQE